MKREWPVLGLVLGWCMMTTPAPAVLINSLDGSGNTNAPSDDPGWSHVGRLANKASGVTYLGSNWFITAYHIKYYDNPSTAVVSGASYAIDSNSWTRITNSTGPYAGTNTDLILFRASGTVSNLGLLTLRNSSLAGGAVTMIGNGKDRETNQSYWTSGWVLTNASAAAYSGYYWQVKNYGDSGTTKRWGTNSIAGSDWIDDGFGITRMYDTTFDAAGGGNEAQGAQYDSGGGVFYKSGSDWQLAGLMLTVDSIAGQPAYSAVYGNPTYSADLSVYRNQIVAVTSIPEPGTAFLLFAGAGLTSALVRWRRRKMGQSAD